MVVEHIPHVFDSPPNGVVINAKLMVHGIMISGRAVRHLKL
jgi:hypothetical protein